MAYKDDTIVAVGFNTNIVVSTNGTNWFQVSSGLPDGGLYAVAEGAGQFVAVGSGYYRGTVLSSSNGLLWTPRFGHTNEEYWAVTYGGGQFVAIGFRNYGTDPNYGAVALTSTDGLQWERFPLSFQTTPRNIAYGNGVYVAAGGPFSLYSTNGRDWFLLSSIPAQAVAFGAGQFIAAAGNNPNGTYRSSNGVDWTEVAVPASPPITFYTAGFANGTFVLAGEGYTVRVRTQAIPMATSTNGIDWTLHSFTHDMQQLVFRDMVFVDGSLYVGDQVGKIWKSGRVAPSARPVITDVARNGTGVSLTFTSLPGFRYTVEHANRLNPLSWSPKLNAQLATTEKIVVTDSNTNDAGFYRVRVE